MEKEGFGEEFSICSAVFFWRNSGGLFGGLQFFVLKIIFFPPGSSLTSKISVSAILYSKANAFFTFCFSDVLFRSEV